MLILLDCSLTGAWHHVHGQVALAQARADVKVVAAARRQGFLSSGKDVRGAISAAQFEGLFKTACDLIRIFNRGLKLKHCNWFFLGVGL